MPKIPIPHIPEDNRKVSPFDTCQKYEWVLDALIKATNELPKITDQALFTLPRTAENHLNQLFRHEIIAILEQIKHDHEAPFLIGRENYPTIRTEYEKPTALTLPRDVDRFWRVF